MGNSTRRLEDAGPNSAGKPPHKESNGQSSFRGSWNTDDSDERMRKEYNTRASHGRRRSVSFEIRSIRRQSSMIHENLVHINMKKNVREVYSGLDDNSNTLGEGTWGTVRVVARRDNPAKKAAIKILQLSDTIAEHRMQELKNEIELLKKIDHPHIARLNETFEDEGLNLYLVMDYFSGGELFDRVIDEGHYKESKAAYAMKQMVGAVQYLHSRGIVHRDLKLENFMYRARGSDNLVLIDFGLSARFHVDPSKPTKTYMKEMVGSSYYMAPEVMKRKYGAECDMWSLGVIAFMLLSGTPPFAGETDAKIMKKVRKGVYAFSHPIWDHTSDEAKDFIKRLLVYEPSDRMTATEAMEHKWFSEAMHRNPEHRRSFIDASVLNNLKNFVHTNRFKKLALQAVAYSCPYEDIAELQQVFEEIDQDHDGYITLEELKLAIENSPHVNNVQNLTEIFQAMDVDKMQKVHLNEFIAATMNHSLLKDERILMDAFNRLDVSESGEIQVADLEDILGSRYTPAQIEQMMAEFTGNDGKKTKISPKEFIAAMRNARIEHTSSLMTHDEASDDDIEI